MKIKIRHKNARSFHKNYFANILFIFLSICERVFVNVYRVLKDKANESYFHGSFDDNSFGAVVTESGNN